MPARMAHSLVSTVTPVPALGVCRLARTPHLEIQIRPAREAAAGRGRARAGWGGASADLKMMKAVSAFFGAFGSLRFFSFLMAGLAAFLAAVRGTERGREGQTSKSPAASSSLGGPRPTACACPVRCPSPPGMVGHALRRHLERALAWVASAPKRAERLLGSTIVFKLDQATPPAWSHLRAPPLVHRVSTDAWQLGIRSPSPTWRGEEGGG